MGILKRYVGWELLRAFGLSLAVFTLAIFFVNCVQYIHRGLDLMHLLKLAPMVIATILTYSLAISVLTGCVMCYGRLSADNEFQGAVASGIHPVSLLGPSIWLGFGAAIVALILQAGVVPEGRYRMSRARKEALSEVSSRLLNVGQRVFPIPGGAIYSSAHRGAKLFNVVVVQEETDEIINVVQAKEGEARFDEEKNAIVYELRDGVYTVFRTRSGGEAGGGDLERGAWHATVETWELQLDFPESERKRKTKELWLGELARKAKGEGPKAHDARVELQSRLSLAVAPLIMVFVGAPLGLLTRRGDRLSGFFIGLALVVVVYYPLYQAGKTLAKLSAISAGGLWLGNLVVGVVGIMLYRRVLRG